MHILGTYYESNSMLVSHSSHQIVGIQVTRHCLCIATRKHSCASSVIFWNTIDGKTCQGQICACHLIGGYLPQYTRCIALSNSISHRCSARQWSMLLCRLLPTPYAPPKMWVPVFSGSYTQLTPPNILILIEGDMDTAVP